VLSLHKFPEVVGNKKKLTRGSLIQPLRNWDLALPVSKRDLSIRYNFVLTSDIMLVKICRTNFLFFYKMDERFYAFIGLWGLFYKGRDHRADVNIIFTGQDNVAIGFFRNKMMDNRKRQDCLIITRKHLRIS
jgi:hypothetical protein